MALRPSDSDLIWWVEPGVIGGMPMPFVYPERRENLGGGLSDYDDELPEIFAAGVRAVVCLLNYPGDAALYRSAGFEFHLMPIKDGSAPTMDQTAGFLRFMNEQRSAQRPTVVHCEAGLGRTGTVVASYLIATGMAPEAAILKVRSVQPRAIETRAQVEFLRTLSAMLQQ